MMSTEKAHRAANSRFQEIQGRVTLAAAIFVACVLGLVVISCAPWPWMVTYLWAFACTAAGTTLGFVFGVPRQAQNANAASPLSHPNLDRLSEWLTGIVVGATLVQAKEIPPYLWRLAEKLARALVGNDTATLASAQAFAAAVIVFFFLMGVIGGYLTTRLLLEEMTRVARAVEEGGRVAPKASRNEEGAPVMREQAAKTLAEDVDHA